MSTGIKMKALFIGPQYLGIYKDIEQGLIDLGYDVDFIPQDQIREDPYYVAVNISRKEEEQKFLYEMEQQWRKRLASSTFSKKYDLLFVLDGMALHPCLFDILIERNPQIKRVNYLFDTIRGVYRFDKYFQYYNRIATFDKEESEKYKIDFLPIYWTNSADCCTTEGYEVFGCGAFKKDRYLLYDRVRRISNELGIKNYLRLYLPKRRFYHVKYLIHLILHTPYIPLRIYHSKMIIHSPLSTDKYRLMLNSACVIVDTSAPHQDGLTARFMWALGSEKKIITNNKTVVEYDFYTPQQVLIVDSILSDEVIKDFLLDKYETTNVNRDIIEKYRIDNWLLSLLKD